MNPSWAELNQSQFEARRRYLAKLWKRSHSVPEVARILIVNRTHCYELLGRYGIETEAPCLAQRLVR